MSGDVICFSRAVYAGEAVDEAVKVFEEFARFELRQTDAHWEVLIEPRDEDPEHARNLRGEFENYVLGLTVQRGGAR